MAEITMMHSQLMWCVFFIMVVALLVLDLGVFHKKEEVPTIRKSMMLSLFYITVAILFGLGIWMDAGVEKAQEYFTGWVIEKSLSVDNLFVISVIFSYFSVPRQHQHRVLFWGILGALLFRAILIFAGSALVSEMHDILYVFSAFLIWTGFRLFVDAQKQKETKIEDNRMLKWLERILPVTKELHGSRFVVKLKGAAGEPARYYFTPLMLSLLCVEWMDLVFAIDSVPAIFAITTDVFIIYTSNIFAVLGLRSLYFALEGLIDQFHYLQYSLAFILVFIGSKMFIIGAMGWEKFPVSISLSVTLIALALGVIASLRLKPR